MINFIDEKGVKHSAIVECKKTKGVNGEKSLSGTIYTNDKILEGIGRGWRLEFENEKYCLTYVYPIDEGNRIVVEFDAVHEFFFDLNKKVVYTELNGSNTAKAYLDIIFNGSGYSYLIEVNIPAFEKEGFGMRNRLDLFKEFISDTGVEFSVNGKVVRILEKVGSNLSTIVKKGFNLNELRIEKDPGSFITYKKGFGAWHDDDDHSKGRLEVEYLSPLASIYGKLEGDPIVDERYKVASNFEIRLKNDVESSYGISVDIDMEDLTKAGYEYEQPHEGDYIMAINKDLGFEQKIRIMSYETSYDTNGNIIDHKVACGSDNIIRKSTKEDDDFRKEIQAGLEGAISTSNKAWVSANGKNAVFEGPDEPTATAIGDTWFQIDGDKKIMRIWNGYEWKPVFNPGEIENKIDQAEKDIAQNIIDIDVALDKATQAELDAGFSKDLAGEAKALGITASSLASEATTNANKAMTDVNTLTGRVTSAEGSITTIAGQVALKANSSDVNTLTGRVTTAEGNITTQGGLIALKANSSDVDTLTGRVSTTESKITATDGKVNTLTTKTDGHTTSIGLLETSYSGLSSTVTALETGKVGNDAFSALEQNLSGFKTTVQNTYADKTTVTQLAGQWTTTTNLVNGHTSQIASLGTDLNLRATKTELLDSMGVTNLITNGGNIQSTAGWYGPVALSKHGFYKGNTANLLYLTTAGTTEITASGEYFNIEPNTKYTVKFTGFASFNVSSMDLWFLSRKKTSSKNYDNNVLLTSTILSSSGLDTRTITFTTNATDDQAYIRFDNNGSTNMANAGLYIVDIILVKGEAAPDRWFESPSDTIMSQINISPESILIASAKIQIKGDTYIESGVIKTAHIADLAVSGAKIANASITSAKIISLDASKIVANDLSAITTNTGQLNVTGWLDFTTENRGLRGSYDFGDLYGEAYDFRWFTGDFRLSHRHLYMYGNMYNVNSNNTKGAHAGYFETFYGSDYTKHRRWNYNGGTMLGRVDITSTYISMSNTYTTENIRLNAQNGDSYFRGTLDIAKDITMRSGYSLFAYNIQSLDTGSNIYFNYSRKDLGDFRIGKDGSSINGGRLVQSLAIYNRTYSGTANMTVTTDGALGRVTSARKYKSDIQVATDVIQDAKKIFQLNPSSWVDKGDIADGIAKKRYYGYIADDFHAIGLHQFVQYDVNGEVDSLDYDRIPIIHHVILKEHEQELSNINNRFNTLDSNVIKLVANTSTYGTRLNNLESEVFRLKKRIEELEKIA